MKTNILKKSVLKKIPLSMASKNTIGQAMRIERVDYFIKASVSIIEHKRILIISWYKRENLVAGKNTPAFRIFMTKKDYISQVFNGEGAKWRTGRFDTLMEWKSWHLPYAVCCDDKSEKILNSFFAYLCEDNKSPICKLEIAQRQIMAHRLEKKHNIIKKQIDTKMKEIGNLPKDFNEWIDETAMAHSRYIFYRYSRKKYMDGYCTHCHKEVKVTGIKHRSEGFCPNCGKKVIFLAEGKAHNIYDQGQAAYFQKTRNGFAVRYFSIFKSYRRNYRSPEFIISELCRDIYEGENTIFYEWREFKQTGNVRWCEGWQKYYFRYTAVYTKNLDTVLKGTVYQYCALKQFAMREEGVDVNVYRYLEEYRHKPYIEYLVKSGLNHLVNEIIYQRYYFNVFNESAQKLSKLLGVRKHEIKLIQELDMSIRELSFYQKACKAGIKMDKAKYTDFYAKYHDKEDSIFKLLSYTSLHKIELYGRKFVDERRSYRNILALWKDYISFCETLNYDLKNDFVLFPQKLIEAHDNAYKEFEKNKEKIRRKQLKEDNKKAQKLLQKYREIYTWENEEFSVVVPKDLFSIKEEGHSLHHCVGSYTSAVTSGKSIILFIRRQTQIEKPFYTMEIKNGVITQCRGFSNHGMTKEVEKFVEQYKSNVLTKIGMKKAV